MQSFRTFIQQVFIVGIVLTAPVMAEWSIDPGWPVKVPANAQWMSPLAIDLNSDGNFEVIFGCSVEQEQFIAFDHTGKYLRAKERLQLISPSVAAAGDLQGDGVIDIVAYRYSTEGFSIYAWSADGALLPGWPVEVVETMLGREIALGDLTGDGCLELLFAAGDKLYVYDYQGEMLPGWPYLQSSIECTPAIGDLNQDGEQEVIFCTSPKEHYPNYYKPTLLFAVSKDGNSLPGWPVVLGDLNEAFVTSPVVGDIDGDYDLEVVVASDITFSSNNPEVFVFHHNGTPVDGWPWPCFGNHEFGFNGSPALADLDGVPGAEIIVSLCDGALIALNKNAELLPGWPTEMQNMVLASPTILDLDGDDDMEIICGDSYYLNPLLYVFNSDGSSQLPFPFNADIRYQNSVLVSDLDNDGSNEMLLLAGEFQGYMMELYSVDLGENTANPYSEPWPVFHGDPWRSGFFSGFNGPARVEIAANRETYKPGKTFRIVRAFRNYGRDVAGRLYLALEDPSGAMLFYPDFSPEPAYEEIFLPHMTNRREILFEGELGDDSLPEAEFTLYMILTDETGRVLSNLSADRFRFTNF